MPFYFATIFCDFRPVKSFIRKDTYTSFTTSLFSRTCQSRTQNHCKRLKESKKKTISNDTKYSDLLLCSDYFPSAYFIKIKYGCKAPTAYVIVFTFKWVIIRRALLLLSILFCFIFLSIRPEFQIKTPLHFLPFTRLYTLLYPNNIIFIAQSNSQLCMIIHLFHYRLDSTVTQSHTRKSLNRTIIITSRGDVYTWCEIIFSLFYIQVCGHRNILYKTKLIRKKNKINCIMNYAHRQQQWYIRNKNNGHNNNNNNDKNRQTDWLTDHQTNNEKKNWFNL